MDNRNVLEKKGKFIGINEAKNVEFLLFLTKFSMKKKLNI